METLLESMYKWTLLKQRKNLKKSNRTANKNAKTTNTITSNALQQATHFRSKVVEGWRGVRIAPSSWSNRENYRRVVPAKFLYILVRMRYFLAWNININCEASQRDSCCAIGCQNRRCKNNPEVSFYRFPSDKTKETKERRKKWIAAVKREKWPESDSQIDNARLCSAHFVTGELFI